jgi:hypothetical protein
MKKALAVLSTAALAVTLGLSAPAEAGKKTRNIVTGIVIGAGAAAVLGAAANAAEESADDPSYAYDDQYDPRQNAIAACLNRAHRILRSRGSEGTELRRVRNVSPVGSSSIRVDLALISYDEFDDPEPSDVTCRVFRDEVRRISIR